MKNYRDSDYALNKHSEGIVYKFADSVVEVTMADYLRENPDKTEADFKALKALSDGMYLEQDRREYSQTYKNISANGMEESDAFATRPIDEEYAEADERRRVLQAADRLFASGELTAIQEKRFRLHIYDKLSARQIAATEGVSNKNVSKSINYAQKKLKKYFDLQG